MRVRSLLRDLVLVCLAVGIGWWARGGSFPVHAQHSSSSSDSARDGGSSLGFQFGGTGLEGSLTLYNPANHTLYVYPAAASNSYINCAYTLRVESLGGPIRRENCAPGSPFPR